jgi:hypothetical protein
MGREEDSLVADFRARLIDWQKPNLKLRPCAASPDHPGRADAALTRINQQLSTRDSFAHQKPCWRPKTGGWTLPSMTGQLLQSKSPWRKLLDGLRVVADNRDALNKSASAAAV